MKNQSEDMLALTVAVEEAGCALREVISRLKVTYYHYDIADWDLSRWVGACEQLESAIAIYQAMMNDWVIAADARPEEPGRSLRESPSTGEN